MELVFPPAPSELRGDLVDALSHDQYWSVGGLCQKIPQRTVEASRQHDALPILCYEGEGAVDVENCAHVTSEQPAPSFRFVDRPKSLGSFSNQVDDTRNR
jgi:hypothetical protein